MAVMTTQPAMLSGGRGIAALMGLEAASLAVASALHLSGLVHGHGHGFSSTGAGAAEAVIGVVLLWGAVSLARTGAAGRPAALGATVFAIAGFIYGLTVTTRGGDLPDITYHATVLPLLIVTLVLILRSKPTAPRPGGSRRTRPGAANTQLRS
jgi:hypothetical protein